MLKHENISSLPAIHSICRIQALDYLMSEVSRITSPDKYNFCGIRTAEYVLK